MRPGVENADGDLVSEPQRLPIVVVVVRSERRGKVRMKVRMRKWRVEVGEDLAPRLFGMVWFGGLTRSLGINECN